jgi:enoyl-CoA hydratase
MGFEAKEQDPAGWWSRWQWPVREAREGIQAVMETNKLVISALRGDVPYGAGLILATVADISIASNTATICERHIDGGYAAGDGAVHWMLSCGVQKAKLLALTCEEISGAEAERIGLVSLAVPDEEVMATAWKYALKLANGPQHTQYFTKRAFNNWLRLGHILTYELSNALELQGIMVDPDFMTSAMWGQAEQGKPRGYDTSTRPPYPSVEKPYVPPTL